MPILFAISVLALVALLWAAFSAAQHVRRARRRRQRSLGAQTAWGISGRMDFQVPASPAKKVTFEEATPFSEVGISRTPAPLSGTPEVPAPVSSAPKVALVVPEPPYVPAPAYVPKLTYSHGSPFVSSGERLSAPPSVSDAPPPPSVGPAPARRLGSGLFSSALIRREEDEARLIVNGHPAPPMPAEIEAKADTEADDAAVPKKPSMALRPSTSRLSLVANSGKMDRPDWAYFNKDMGDLTDPYESPRTRPRAASGDARR